jgi:predicted RNA methylase
VKFNPDGSDVFVDYGSGLGRVLVCAAMYPVRKVIGVEFSPQLNEAAWSNIGNARKWMDCREVEIVAVDAALYPVPDDATLLYFANPFRGSILAAVLEQIEASLERAPRRIQFISHSHEAHSPFEQQVRKCPWLQSCAEVRLLRGYRAWIYTNNQWTK